MDHAARVVEALIVDRHAGASGFLEENHELSERDALIHRLDVGTRHHHILDADFPEAEDVVEHRPLLGRKGGVAVGIRHQRVGEILAQARRTRTAPQAGRTAPEG
ncbi:hypothetical protein ABIA22_003111 [Sinorhizobium fredii]